MLVETFVAQPADEAFDERVLHRSARRDVVPINACILRPSQDGMAGQFGAVITDDRGRLATLGDDLVQFTGDPVPRQGRVGDDR